MLLRMSSYFIIVIFIATAIGLFAIKDSVSNLNYQLGELNRQIIQEKNTIHMLKAEIAYLTSPARLRKLATNYLELDNVKSTQMIKDPIKDNGEVQNIENTDLTINLVKRNVKWRYKRAPNKYLKTVSERR